MSQRPAEKARRTRISLASRAGDRASPLGLIGSLALHGLIIAGMMFTFTRKLDIIDQSSPVVPVDLVTLAARTNVMPAAKPLPKPLPEPSTPDTRQTAVPQPAPPPESAPPPEAAPAESAVMAPPPPATPRHEKPKTEKKSFDVDNVLALLNKVAPSSSRSAARTADRATQGIGAETAMTADLQSMLLSEIKPCWSPPVGAPHPEDLIVDFDVMLNPDGSVARPPQLLAQSSQSADDPYFRAAAEAARRAIYTCAPYKLPADSYAYWREISDFRFDPRQMMGD
jgi:outer membrane biosynthesis protein TonB